MGPHGVANRVDARGLVSRVGLEPTANGLKGRCSTIELHPPCGVRNDPENGPHAVRIIPQSGHGIAGWSPLYWEARRGQVPSYLATAACPASRTALREAIKVLLRP